MTTLAHPSFAPSALPTRRNEDVRPSWVSLFSAASELAAAAEAGRPLPRTALVDLGLDPDIADRYGR